MRLTIKIAGQIFVVVYNRLDFIIFFKFWAKNWKGWSHKLETFHEDSLVYSIYIVATIVELIVGTVVTILRGLTENLKRLELPILYTSTSKLQELLSMMMTAVTERLKGQNLKKRKP